MCRGGASMKDRKSTRLNSSHMSISYAVFCLKKKREITAIKMLQKQRVDGIIVIAYHLCDQYPRLYGRSKFPIVIINEQKPGDIFFFNDTATTEIYTLSLHDALPI